ncbi:hypothetical protein WN944_029552 [Citrus x changshan-huyou]|uniref:Transmembrane protein n=1 Tax=Citrus x changshan-huyou TaxID=2935761 RepID=A0AAP0QBU2_9ROSI
MQMEKLALKLVAMTMMVMMIIVLNVMPAAIEAARADRFHPEVNWQCCPSYPINSNLIFMKILKLVEKL